MTSLTKASSNLNRQGRQWLQPTRQIPTEFKNSSPCFISQEQTSPTVTTTGSRWASPSPVPSVRAVVPTFTTSAPSTVDTMPGKPTKSTTNASAQRMDVLTSQRSSIWQSRPECHFPNTNIRRPKPQRDMMEDVYIPVRGGDAATRVDTTPGLTYDGITDIRYYQEKLFAALRIPKAYLGFEKDLAGKSTLSAEDIRFARTIERIQRIVEAELTKIAIVHLYTLGFTGESLTNFELKLSTPSIIFEQEKIALLKEKVDLARQMQETGLFL